MARFGNNPQYYQLTAVLLLAPFVPLHAPPASAAEPTSFIAALRAEELEQQFANPPTQARLRAYWWWLNGNVTKEAITKDLEWMKPIGMGGGLVFDAGGATQGGHDAGTGGAIVRFAGMAGVVQAHTSRSGPAWAGNRAEHPERLEPRRADGYAG